MTSGGVRKEALGGLETTERCPKECDCSSNEGLVDLVVVLVQFAAERDRGPMDLVVVLV